jgi:hypothetical protein
MTDPHGKTEIQRDAFCKFFAIKRAQRKTQETQSRKISPQRHREHGSF